MCFGEPHPFPIRGSPTRLNVSGQQSYEGWSCRTEIRQYRKDGHKFISTLKQSTAADVPIFTDQQTVVYISCTELYPSRT